MLRRRDKVIVAKKVDVPVGDYDSMIEYYHNGYQRASIDIVSPHNPLNGISGRDTKNNTINYKLRIFKDKQVEIDHEVLWFDGVLPRLLRISKVQQDPKSRRHIYLYCTEKSFGEDAIVNKTTYGDNLY